MTDPRHILITNDDGIDADALPPLADALSRLGDVDIIVPERNWSGASHSITLFRPLRVRPTKLRGGQPAYMTDGSPTDCVRLAVLGFLRHRPDLVGLLSSIPSIAISIGAFGGDTDYGPAASFAALLARNILDRGLPPDTLLNVNVPPLPRAEITGVEVTRLGKRTYRDQLVERLDPYGNPYYWVGGPAVSEEAEDGTDVAAMRAGKISVTPIALDLTNHALLEELARWDWGWTAPVALSAD